MGGPVTDNKPGAAKEEGGGGLIPDYMRRWRDSSPGFNERLQNQPGDFDSRGGVWDAIAEVGASGPTLVGAGGTAFKPKSVDEARRLAAAERSGGGVFEQAVANGHLPAQTSGPFQRPAEISETSSGTGSGLGSANPGREETGALIARAHEHLRNGEVGAAVPLLQEVLRRNDIVLVNQNTSHDRKPAELINLGAALHRSATGADGLNEARGYLEEALLSQMPAEIRTRTENELAKVRKSLELQREYAEKMPEILKQVESVLESNDEQLRRRTLRQLLQFSIKAEDLEAYGLAVEPLRQALRLMPDSPGLLNDLAVNLAITGTRESRAESADLLRRAVENSRAGAAFDDSLYISIMELKPGQYEEMIKILPSKLKQITAPQ